jgi:hypothetical protein
MKPLLTLSLLATTYTNLEARGSKEASGLAAD